MIDWVYSYNWMDDEIQENAINAYIDHVRYLQEQVIEYDLDVRLIPTNKGWTYEHFVEYQELYDEFDYEEFAFYAVQYTGGDAGNAINVLRRHVRNSIAALDMGSVFLIGGLAEDDLLDFAPRVRGATGLRQWKDACSTENGLSKDLWPKFKESREAKLSVNDGQEQRPMNEFSGKKEAN